MSKEIERLMKNEGHVKGEIILTSLKYIKSRLGKEGLKKIEDRFKELGYSLYFQNIKPLHDYKEAYAVLIYLLSRDLFGWNDKDIWKMGESSAKMSFIAKVLLKYFISVNSLVEEMPNYWKKYHDFGEIKVIDFNEKNKYIIFQLRGYDFHPLGCTYHLGYFFTVARFSIKGENISLNETKCVHKGDDFHEYKITWE